MIVKLKNYIFLHRIPGTQIRSKMRLFVCQQKQKNKTVFSFDCDRDRMKISKTWRCKLYNITAWIFNFPPLLAVLLSLFFNRKFKNKFLHTKRAPRRAGWTSGYSLVSTQWTCSPCNQNKSACFLNVTRKAAVIGVFLIWWIRPYLIGLLHPDPVSDPDPYYIWIKIPRNFRKS